MKNRRKLLEFIMASTMLLLVYICAGKLPAMSSGSSKVTKQGENGKIILLDAGHGGTDPGKISVTDTVLSTWKDREETGKFDDR